MGLALQRLLNRSYSLDFLRCLLGAPIPIARHHCRAATQYRRFTSLAAADETKDYNPASNLFPSHSENPSRHEYRISVPKQKLNVADIDYGPWQNGWTQVGFEYESNLEKTDPARPKLLKDPFHSNDHRLWAALLDYRRRIYGSDGVRMYWKAVRNREWKLPTKGYLAQRVWTTFFRLGFEDDKILHEVCDHADQVLKVTGQAWPGIYMTVMEHILLVRRGPDAIAYWQKRLLKLYRPSEKAFVQLCKNIIYGKGDMEGLKWIYSAQQDRGLYSKIVPTLCQQEDFPAALSWHSFLVSKGDLPQTMAVVEPLIAYYSVYEPGDALRITDSLRRAEVAFLPKYETDIDENLKISRTMMNLIHGQKFGIEPKQYNDSLGARWFATTWVSLDVAINAVAALGVEQIGPLSLQALALREPDAANVTRRLNQLGDAGISIGPSLFSRAVDHFARNDKHEFLHGLLTSDQHPDALEDRNLQDDLATSFAQTHDWSQFRRTREILYLGTKRQWGFKIDNVVLRSFLTMGDMNTFLLKLRQMQMAGQVVTPYTIQRMLRYVLRPRRHGKRPQTRGSNGQPFTHPLRRNDLTLVIEIMRNIMVSGSFVPIVHWKEILKRLGMAGRVTDLQVLCEFLASWYGPANKDQSVDLENSNRRHRYRIPECVPTNNLMHPLRILFSTAMQMAIVEWGFNEALGRMAPRKLPRRKIPDSPKRDITDGIQLLKRLNGYGVYIYTVIVRRALVNRFVSCFGHGTSNRKRIRACKRNNPYTLQQMVHKVHEALGWKMFDLLALKQEIRRKAVDRIDRRDLLRKTLKSTRDPAVFKRRISTKSRLNEPIRSDSERCSSNRTASWAPVELDPRI